MNFILALKEKNETLYYFGLLCLAFSILLLALTKFSSTQVYNVSAWYKPFKFAFSTFLFAWAMIWYCSYLPDFNITRFNWALSYCSDSRLCTLPFKQEEGSCLITIKHLHFIVFYTVAWHWQRRLSPSIPLMLDTYFS
jgi:membrane protease YdiL (CAAX protease family)